MFHEHGTFAALWLLVIFVGIEILAKARDILEPILWAFFLMMGLVPLTDLLERNLQRLWQAIFPKRGKERRPASSRTSSHSTARSGELELPLPPRPEEEVRGVPGSDDSAEEYDPRATEKGGLSLARPVAVLSVISLTMGTAALFFFMVYRSAEHMQDNFGHYKNGSQNVTVRIKRWVKNLPDEMVDSLTTKALTAMETAMSSILQGILEATTHTALEMLWIGLYMIFWLCQPFHVGQEVSTVFRQYIFLKGIASSGYAFCVWVLLHVLGVDLAIVFGLITFVFNFIPEIGPFIAMLLPLPVILFDDRIAQPVEFVLLALAGQLGLKVIFGNIIEIKLIESQQEMRMHPVIILFFVAFFQFIWGATGMLLSVPIVAALKATLHKIPPYYRDRALIFLEGDQTAPQRWEKWRESISQDLPVHTP